MARSKKIESVLSGRYALSREIGTVFIVCTCMLLTQSGVGVGISTLDYVSRTFKIEADPAKQSWLAASYSLLVGTLVLPMGSAGDLLGHKKLVVIGFGWFALWSLIAGLSNYAGSHIFFDVCRGFQGAGPAMILPNGVAILGRMYRAGSTRKYFAFCAFAATAPNGFMVAAVFCGIFVQKTAIGWPLSFYVFAAVLAIVTVASYFILPSEAELLAIHHQHVAEDREKVRAEAEANKLGGDEKSHAQNAVTSSSQHASQNASQNGETESISSTLAVHQQQQLQQQDQPQTHQHHLNSDMVEAGFHSNDDDEDRVRGVESEGPPPKFDWIGASLGVSALLLLNVAWNQGGVVGWQSPQTYIMLIIGLLLGAAFVYSSFALANPLLPPDVWTTANALVLGCVAFGWASFGLWSFYAYRIWLVIRERTVLTSVAYMSPVSITGILAAFMTGYLLQAVGPGPVLFISMCFFCLGSVLIGTMPAQQIYWTASFFSMLLTPIGMDTSFPSASIIISDHLPHSRQGQAGSLVNTVINWSIAIGLGFGGTAERYVTQRLRNDPDSTLSPKEITFRGYRAAMYVAIGLSSLAILLSLVNWAYLIRRASKRRREEEASGTHDAATVEAQQQQHHQQQQAGKEVTTQ